LRVVPFFFELSPHCLAAASSAGARPNPSSLRGEPNGQPLVAMAAKTSNMVLTAGAAFSTVYGPKTTRTDCLPE